MSPEQIELVRQLRAAGMGWVRIGKAVGLGEHRIRRIVDPEYRARRNKLAERRRPRPRKNEVGGPLSAGVVGRPSAEKLRAIALALPSDTRGLTARLMGDPLPGRSALEQRKNIPGTTGGNRAFRLRDSGELADSARSDEGTSSTQPLHRDLSNPALQGGLPPSTSDWSAR